MRVIDTHSLSFVCLAMKRGGTDSIASIRGAPLVRTETDEGDPSKEDGELPLGDGASMPKGFKGTSYRVVSLASSAA